MVNPGKRPCVQSKVPPSTITPAIAAPCPPRYLVAECTTMSAPWAIGWIRYGVAMVLSTISGTPFSCATADDPGGVEDVDLRVGDGLGEERLGVRSHRRPPRIQVVGVVDEADLDAELGQRVVEQVVGAAVEPRAGHDVIAGGGQVQDRERLGGLPGRQEQRRHPALERGDALLDDVGGRVPDPGVDVAGLGQAEQRRGVRRCRRRCRTWSGRSAARGRWSSGHGCWPAWICLVSNDQCAVGSVRLGVVGAHVSCFLLDGEVGVGCSQRPGTVADDDVNRRRRLATTHDEAHIRMGAHQVSLSTLGPVTADPRLPCSRLWLLNLVITRGTPPRLEGCRPASRGLTLALMTNTNTSCECSLQIRRAL